MSLNAAKKLRASRTPSAKITILPLILLDNDGVQESGLRTGYKSRHGETSSIRDLFREHTHAPEYRYQDKDAPISELSKRLRVHLKPYAGVTDEALLPGVEQAPTRAATVSTTAGQTVEDREFEKTMSISQEMHQAGFKAGYAEHQFRELQKRNGRLRKLTPRERELSRQLCALTSATTGRDVRALTREGADLDYPSHDNVWVGDSYVRKDAAVGGNSV
jgi:hypothetical protein